MRISDWSSDVCSSDLDSNTPILKADGSTTIADSNDFSSILKVGGKLYAVSQFESQPGAMYLTTLSQDGETGKLSATDTQAIDLSAINGIWNRSEEHTSELHVTKAHLVCRLLLEKKKMHKNNNNPNNNKHT